MRGLVGSRRDRSTRRAQAVTARLIARSPNSGTRASMIEKGGRADGIKVEQARDRLRWPSRHDPRDVTGDGRGHADHDASSAVYAQVMQQGANGIVKPEVGNPRTCARLVEKGRRVTQGTTWSRRVQLLARGVAVPARDPDRSWSTHVDLDEIELLPARAIRPIRRPPADRLREGLTSRGHPRDGGHHPPCPLARPCEDRSAAAAGARAGRSPR